MFIPSLSIGAGLIELGGGLAATAVFLLFVGALLTALAYLEPGTVAPRPLLRRNGAPHGAPATGIPTPGTGVVEAGSARDSLALSPIPVAQGTAAIEQAPRA